MKVKMKKGLQKRVISLFLVLALIITSVPLFASAVMAEDDVSVSLKSAINAYEEKMDTALSDMSSGTFITQGLRLLMMHMLTAISILTLTITAAEQIFHRQMLQLLQRLLTQQLPLLILGMHIRAHMLLRQALKMILLPFLLNIMKIYFISSTVMMIIIPNRQVIR